MFVFVGTMPMASETFIEPLLRVSLFRGLTHAQLTGIARKAERVMFRIGQTIVKSGEVGDGAFLLIVGEGSIVEGEPRSAAARDMVVVQTGSLIGELPMLIDADYSTTVVAKTAVRALKITRAALQAQMERDPELAAHFVAKLSARLRDFTDELRRIESGLDPSASGANAIQNETPKSVAIPHFSGHGAVATSGLQRAG
jgi:CRP-like cAMP-binding protein